ncbi:hypothetical protein OF001_U140103 [Pseudomonas sp. OF001]|nr:hypothetical protein OF001_U140103 [Pseudomonas sp. OF001]
MEGRGRAAGRAAGRRRQRCRSAAVGGHPRRRDRAGRAARAPASRHRLLPPAAGRAPAAGARQSRRAAPRRALRRLRPQPSVRRRRSLGQRSRSPARGGTGAAGRAVLRQFRAPAPALRPAHRDPRLADRAVRPAPGQRAAADPRAAGLPAGRGAAGAVAAERHLDHLQRLLQPALRRRGLHPRAGPGAAVRAEPGHRPRPPGDAAARADRGPRAAPRRPCGPAAVQHRPRDHQAQPRLPSVPGRCGGELHRTGGGQPAGGGCRRPALAGGGARCAHRVSQPQGEERPARRPDRGAGQPGRRLSLNFPAFIPIGPIACADASWRGLFI